MYLDSEQFLKHNQNILNIKKAPNQGANWSLTLSNYIMVRMRGLEPPRRKAPDPKSGVYTNFTTSAYEYS